MIDRSFLFDAARNLYGAISYNNKLGKAIMPLRYTLELTYRCNLTCPYCYIGEDRNKSELTTQEWFNIIDQIPFYALVTIIGGEVLLRKDFLSIFEKASKKTMGKVNVVSNGVLLTEEIIDSFIKNKLLMLSVSLDGYGVMHDENRGQSGIFDKIINNLELFNTRRNNKKPIVDIKTVVLENNIDDLVKLYKLCSEMRFDFFSISFKRNYDLKQNSILRETFGEEFYAKEYPIEPYFDMEHFKEVYKELESISKQSETKLRWAPKFKPTGDIKTIEKFFSLGRTKVDEIYHPCLYPFSNMLITPAGDVYPCLSLNIGNVKNKKIIDVFNETKFKCFRKNLKASKVFNSCQMCCELLPKIR